MTTVLGSSTGGMTTMEVDAFLADTAEAVQGKVYALGIGWDTVYVRSLPAVHPRASIGLTIRVPYTATNQMHTVLVHLEDEDGGRALLGEEPSESDAEPKQVFEIGGQFNVGRPPLLPPGDAQVVCLALTVNGLRLEKPGMFHWVISVDGTPLKRLPMRVQLLTQQMAM
jgi:hypothetical protein